jgi:hypothetical protein
MSAVWMRARADLRAGARSLVALAILLGVLGGLAMAAGAGARRTNSAYDRFIASTTPPDAFVYSGTPRTRKVFPPIPLQRVLHLPEVSSGAIEPILSGELLDRGGHVLVSGDNLTTSVLFADGPAARMARVKLLSGRLPDPKSTSEIAIGYDPAIDRRAPVGSSIQLASLRPSVDPTLFLGGSVPQRDYLPPIPVRVVGVVLSQGELTGYQEIWLTPAIADTYGRRSLQLSGLGVRLRHGITDYAAFSRDVQNLAPGAAMYAGSAERASVDAQTHLFALALWVFAALAAITGLLVFGQALFRQIFVDAAENPGLRTLGMTENQLFGLTMLRTAAVAVGGLIVALPLAFLLSMFMPIGRIARLAEPAPGLSFDPVVLLAGAAALLAVTFAIAAGPAWRAARARGDAGGVLEPPRSRPSTVAAAFARRGLAPTAVAGVRMALEPGRGRTATPVRSALVGAAISITALMASMTFGASLRHLVETPRLYGVGWQYEAGNPFGSAGSTLADLRRDPHVGSITAAILRDFVTLRSHGHAVGAGVFVTQPIRGSVHPTVVQGRWPSSSSEIAIGAKTLRAVGASVGSTISVSAGHRVTDLRVVGQVVLPDFGLGSGLGDGAGLTLGGFRRVEPGAQTNVYGFDFRPGTDVPSEIRHLDRVLPGTPGSQVISPRIGDRLNNLQKIQGLLLAMAGLIAVTALAALTHLLVTSIRRRRRDLAILKTLGFVRRQVWATVAWQASCVALVALVVGLPVGIAAGRWTWNLFAGNVGVVPEPAVPLLAALLVVPITIVAANIAAALPARAAGRVRPGSVLRSE